MSEGLQEFKGDELLELALMASVPLSLFRDLAGHSSLEVRGVCSSWLSHNPCPIDPLPSFDEGSAFLLKYLHDCLVEDPDGEWSETRYGAAHSLASLYRAWRSDSTAPGDHFDRARRETRELFASLIRLMDPHITLAVETGALEHLLVDEEIRLEFAEWLSEPILAAAYHGSIDSWSPAFEKRLRGPSGNSFS